MSARRRNGVWYSDFSFEGTRYRRRSPVNTKRGAEQHERLLRKRLRQGLSIDGEPKAQPDTQSVSSTSPSTKEVPTFKEFANEFMNTYVKANNKASEQTEKRNMLRCHLLPAFGELRLDEIDTRRIETFKAHLLNGKRSRKRVNNILGTLRRIMSYAVEIDILEKAPKVKRLKCESRAVKFLDFAPYERLLKVAEDQPLWHAAILAGADAGLRLGEIRALRPEHWDRARGKISVERSLWRNDETATKGWNRRTVPLTDRLQAALIRLTPCRRTYLIAFHDTEPLTLETTRWHLPKLFRKAGLDPIGWHSLRHTFCSHLAMMGAPPRTIQELAGHADLSTTLKYMHLVAGETDRAIDLLNKRRREDSEHCVKPTDPSDVEPDHQPENPDHVTE